ncbi:MAG TPA: DUF4163 domain-containing protein [Brevundimonas sp.]|nr:DUF4163 domain-containing protein [Brevundimonas sp.]
MTIPPLRSLGLATVLALAALAGCNRDREPDSPNGPAARASAAPTAAAGVPIAFESKTPWADVSLSLPASIKAQPELHPALYTEEVRRLRQFVEGAQGELTEAGADSDLPKYAKNVRFSTALQTGKLLSLKRVDYDYSGGAHPNTLTTGLLWDKTLERRIGLADLFPKGTDLTVLDQALCSALNAAKRARAPGSPGLTLGGSGFSCPRARDTAFVLTASDATGKAGGLTFLIDPYQAGPYAEGAYEIAVPATVFRSLLVPSYSSEFGSD